MNENATQVTKPATPRFGNLGYIYSRRQSSLKEK